MTADPAALQGIIKSGSRDKNNAKLSGGKVRWKGEGGRELMKKLKIATEKKRGSGAGLGFQS